MSCPEFSEIVDLAEDRLDPSSRKKIEAHISECVECAEKKMWAERNIGAMKRASQLSDAPEFAVQKAISLMPAQRPAMKDWIRAVLDFDSWAAPAVAGVRAEARGPRQCVYVTDAYRVMLMLEASDRKGRLVGQLVGKSPWAVPAHCLVEVSDAKKMVGQTVTGETGEFLLEVPVNRQLQLKIHGDPESILVSCKL